MGGGGGREGGGAEMERGRGMERERERGHRSREKLRREPNAPAHIFRVHFYPGDYGGRKIRRRTEHRRDVVPDVPQGVRSERRG